MAVTNLTSVTAEQLLLRDCVMRCAWYLDRGDSQGFAACFTPDGAVVLRDGKRYEGTAGIRRFVAEAGRTPGFRGRQHHVQPMFVENSPDGPVVVSYFQVLQAKVGEAPAIVSMGYYRDLVHEREGRWLIKQRNLYRWNSEQAPRAGDVSVKASHNPMLSDRGQQSAQPSIADRLEMERLMVEYAAALDTGDLARMAEAFESDGELISSSLGKLIGPAGLRRFLANNTKDPAFAGRQHRIFPLVFEQVGEGWRAYAYWKVETWTLGKPATVLALGYYEDLFSKRSGRWKLASKAIRRWNNEAAPMAPTWPESE
jgi:hypothetical protein